MGMIIALRIIDIIAIVCSPAKGTRDSEEKASVDETPWRVLAVGFFTKITYG